MGVVRIVPILFGASHDLLASLADDLADIFHLKIETALPTFDPELAFDVSRGQYNSRVLLGQLLREKTDSATRLLGVTAVDLFIPVLTYVFGEAQLDGRAAVVSTCRLENELYGLPPNRDLLLQRLIKEAVHELGHTCNLVHCRRHPCVMISSTYVEDIDGKSSHFCDECLQTVRKATG